MEASFLNIPQHPSLTFLDTVLTEANDSRNEVMALRREFLSGLEHWGATAFRFCPSLTKALAVTVIDATLSSLVQALNELFAAEIVALIAVTKDPTAPIDGNVKRLHALNDGVSFLASLNTTAIASALYDTYHPNGTGIAASLVPDNARKALGEAMSVDLEAERALLVGNLYRVHAHHLANGTAIPSNDYRITDITIVDGEKYYIMTNGITTRKLDANEFITYGKVIA